MMNCSGGISAWDTFHFDRVKQLAQTGQLPKRLLTSKKEALLCSVSVWENDKKTLEGQGRQYECHKNSYTTRTDRVCGLTRVHFARAYCASEGQTDPTMIQVCYEFRQPVILGVHIRFPSTMSHEQGNCTS